MDDTDTLLACWCNPPVNTRRIGAHPDAESAVSPIAVYASVRRRRCPVCALAHTVLSAARHRANRKRLARRAVLRTCRGSLPWRTGWPACVTAPTVPMTESKLRSKCRLDRQRCNGTAIEASSWRLHDPWAIRSTCSKSCWQCRQRVYQRKETP